MVDLRHTLPNLKYLLTVLTTGKGEVPVRKRPGSKRLDSGSEAEGKKADAQAHGTEKELHANGKFKEMGAVYDESG